MSEETLKTIATFYKFAEFPDFEEWKNKLKDWGKNHEILGTIIIAPEGINATVSGPREGIENFINLIREDVRFSDLSPRLSEGEPPSPPPSTEHLQNPVRNCSS